MSSLPNFVVTESVVTETVTPTDADLRSGRSYVSFRFSVFVILLAMSSVLAWGLWLCVDRDQLWWLIGVLFAILAVIGLAVLLSGFAEKKQSEPYEITFDGQRIRFQRGQNWIHAPVREMRWSEGQTNHAIATRELPLWQKCLILHFPTGFSAGCGLTPESRTEWLNVLRHAEVKELINREGLNGLIFGLLQIALAMAGAFCGYQIGATLDQAIAGLVWLQAMAGSFAPAMCIAGLWLGFVLLPLSIPGWRRDTAVEQDRWRRAAIVIPFKLGIPLLLGQPPAGLPMGVSLIVVVCLIALTIQFLCNGPRLKNRQFETNF